MKQIDFLPSSYHEQSSKRKLKLWRAGVVALIGGTVVSAALYQRYLIKQVDQQLAELEPQHTASAAIMAHLEQVNKELRDAGAQAELYTYIRHPWPRTQIVAALIAPVPDSIKFSDLHIVRESPAHSVGAYSTVNSQAQPSEDDAIPAKRDLEKLRRVFDGSLTVVTVNGTTDEVAGLHEYLEEVRRSRLIDKATIKSIQASNDSDAKLQFAAEFVVRASYGQPGGPVSGDLEAAEASAPVAANQGAPTQDAS